MLVFGSSERKYWHKQNINLLLLHICLPLSAWAGKISRQNLWEFVTTACLSSRMKSQQHLRNIDGETVASQPQMYQKQRQSYSSSAAAETFITGRAVNAGLRTAEGWENFTDSGSFRHLRTAEGLENFTDSGTFRHLIFSFEVFDYRLLLSHRSLTEKLISEK